MTPNDVEDAVIAILAATFPGWGVELYDGQFAERGLPLVLAKIPILLVSVLRIPDFTPHGHRRFRGTLGLAVYVLGVNQAGSRETSALAMVYSLLTLLQGQRWGLADALPPISNSLSAENLETVHANNLRVSLWAVSWDQTFTFS